jgi:RHS repeat-associated protein
MTSKYVYDGLHLVQENDATSQTKVVYVSGSLDAHLQRIVIAGTFSRIDSYLSDHLGSILALKDMDGTSVVTYSYDAYGAGTASTRDNNPFQFAGRENDETGLYYYRARYYSPYMQRFIQSDPIGLNGGINTYDYVLGDPINFNDPLGLESKPTIMCDRNGNYTVVNYDTGPIRECTEIHERSHINDWVKRYGKDSCVGQPPGYLPMGSVNGDNYRDFRRDSECRANAAEQACVKKCNIPKENKRWNDNNEANYCSTYSSWKNY